MEIPQWIIGGLGGAFITAIGLAWRFGGVFTKTEVALNQLTELITKIEERHEKHEEKNEVQITALWKVVDQQGRAFVVLENEVQNLKKDVHEVERKLDEK